ARKPVEGGRHLAAALVERGNHAGDRILGAGEGGDAGELRRRVNAGVGIDGEPGRALDQGRRPDAVAETPAGHGVAFAPAFEQDDPVAEILVGEEANVPAVAPGIPVVEAAVDLVAEDGD